MALLAALTSACVAKQQPAPAAAPPATMPVTWRHPSESSWIVHTVAEEITRAVRGGGPAVVVRGRGAAFDLAAGAVRATVDPTPHLWAPEAYEAWASAVLGPSAGAPTGHESGGVPDDALLKLLSDLGPEPLLRANRLVSDALRARPHDAAEHQRAALVVASFALREQQGWFYDPRVEAARLAAHLALARSLAPRAEPTRAGVIARIVLETIAVRQRDALARIDAAEALDWDEVGRSWLRALRMENTRDWRLAGPEPTEFETGALVRALRLSVSGIKALHSLGDAPRPITDWGRHILVGHVGEVGTGNALIDRQLALETLEVQAVFPRASGDETLAGHLAAAGDDADVIDGQLWARFLERRLAEYAGVYFLHYRRKLGLGRAELAQPLAQLDARIGPLPLLVFSRFRRAEAQSDLEPLLPELQELLSKQPERVTAGNWWSAREKPGFGGGLASRLPDQSIWFTPPLPPGTAFDVGRRVRRLPTLMSADTATLEAIWELAPHDSDLGWRLARPGKEPATAQALNRYFGAAIEFDSRVRSNLADTFEDEPERYVPFVEKLAEVDSDRWWKLGKYLETRDEVAAARAYEKMWKLGADRVLFSGHSDWLIAYYRRTGRTREALRLAEDAGVVHSARGLDTYAELLEDLNRLDEAAAARRAKAERYGDWGSLIAFLRRTEQSRGGAATKRLVDEAVAHALPQGLERVDISDFSAPPTDGVVLKSTSPKAAAAGLDRGSVLVAMNGLRVRNTRALSAIREFVDGPRYRLIAWHAGRYVESELELQGGRLGVDVADYRR